MKKIAVIGECMVELLKNDVHSYRQSFSGDTFNFAYYLKKNWAECEVEYITNVGLSPISDEMLAFFEKHDIGCQFIERIPNKNPGLYLIHTEQGERFFEYWRNDSAARFLFNSPNQIEKLEELLKFDLIYFSAITLAILNTTGRKELFNFLRQAKEAKVKIAFDSNYRPSLYESKRLARELYQSAMEFTEIFLPSLDDEIALWGDQDYNNTLNRIKEFDCKEIVITQGQKEIIYFSNNRLGMAKTEAISKVVDTTAAGDSFNAGYLSSRLQGSTIPESIKNAQKLATRVIMHQGALIDE